MSRTPILIGAAVAFVLSASAASALPLAPQRASQVPEAAPLVEPVHYRKVRKFRHVKRHHFFKPHFFAHRRHKPSFSFSLHFGSPVHRPYHYYSPYYHRPYYRTYHPYSYGW